MDPINERFKVLRKECNKTQTEWGKILGIQTSGISDIEKGRRRVTEQHIIMLRNWNEFKINEKWLRTGEGEMFLMPQKNDLIAKAALLLGDHDPVFEAFVDTYSKLSTANRKILLDFGSDFLDSFGKHKQD